MLHIGISDTPAWAAAQANTFARAHGLTPFAALQARYNLLSRDAERDLIPAAEFLGMSVAAWSPQGGGVLSGKFTRPGGTDAPTRVRLDSISERDHAVVGVVRDVADELGASTSQVSLAWTMARSPAVHPIVGVRRLDQLHDNLGAADVTLPPERWTGSTTSCSATPTRDRRDDSGGRCPAEESSCGASVAQSR